MQIKLLHLTPDISDVIRYCIVPMPVTLMIINDQAESDDPGCNDTGNASPTMSLP
jgi:hypothetical protein